MHFFFVGLTFILTGCKKRCPTIKIRRDAVVLSRKITILRKYSDFFLFINQRNEYVKSIKTSKFRNFQSLKEKISLFRLINNRNMTVEEKKSYEQEC